MLISNSPTKNREDIMKKTIASATMVIHLLSSPICMAAQETSSELSFKPILIDSKNSTGSTVGVEYEIKGDLFSMLLEEKNASDGFDPNATIGAAEISYSALGTVAASASRNPKNFIEFRLDGRLRYSTPHKGTFRAGLFTNYETNQSFNNKQTVYGLAGTWGKQTIVARNDFFSIDAGYGRVDPKDDAERKKVLGSMPLEAYYRWSLELLYKIPIRTDVIRALEFNYRYFKEINPPSRIKNASLDVHQLGTLRVELNKDLFLAYSSGKLPFDRKDDKIVQVGLSYNLW